MRKRPNKKGFWDREYRAGVHLAISDEPSEDLQKFCRFVERAEGRTHLNQLSRVIDLGCGNGRNLFYMAEEYGMRGTGIDTSDQAIAQAKKKAAEKEFSIEFEVRSIALPLPVPDNSQTIVLDMMTSHVLKSAEREALLQEILRVMRPAGWLFFKTFLLEEDRNAAQLLKDHPGSEPGSYIHPEIGVEEHVFTEDEITDLLSPYFTIHRMLPSHRHMKHGRPHKRRSVSVYAQRG
jgi:SAM-dependent methyltransferase